MNVKESFKWQREGGYIYLLEETGRFIKVNGKFVPELQSKFTIRVDSPASHLYGTIAKKGYEEAEQLVQRLVDFLNKE